MKKVSLITDSTAYLPASLMQQFAISTIPLAVIWGQESYEDGVTIKPGEFYTRLKSARSMPGTSQPSVGKIQLAFEQMLVQDCDVLAIFLSSKLSGTYQAALQAKELVRDKNRVEIVDSQTTTLAMGFQILAAARAAGQGLSLAECRTVAEQARRNSGVYFIVDTLEFLYRGGRIGGGQRFLGTALNIKPILCMHEGKIESYERARTKSRGIERITELVAEKCMGKVLIRLAGIHANAEQEAKQMLENAAALLKPVETIIAELSPVIGAHVGPGTIALAYMTGI